jgi:hypothetical protein
MRSSLPFELAVLEAMPEMYAAELLASVSLSLADVKRIRAECLVGPADLMTLDAESYVELLGPPKLTRRLEYAEANVFAPSSAHSYSLLLWPHLYWVVNIDSDARTWGVGFQNQGPMAFKSFLPEFVRPGFWTRSALRDQAVSEKPYDGWENALTVHLQFRDGGQYEASYIFGLLNGWKKLK